MNFQQAETVPTRSKSKLHTSIVDAFLDSGMNIAYTEWNDDWSLPCLYQVSKRRGVIASKRGQHLYFSRKESE